PRVGGREFAVLCRWWAAFFFQAEDGIRDLTVTGVQTCALPISRSRRRDRADPLGARLRRARRDRAGRLAPSRRPPARRPCDRARRRSDRRPGPARGAARALPREDRKSVV